MLFHVYVLPVCISRRVGVFSYQCLFMCMSPPFICPSVFILLRVYSSVYVSLLMCVPPYVHSVCMCVRVYVPPCVYPFMCMSPPCVYPSVCIPSCVYLFMYVSLRVYAPPCVCPFMYVSLHVCPKQHGRERCADERFWHRRSKIKSRTTVYDFGGKILDSAGQHSRESAIAVVKEFGLA